MKKNLWGICLSIIVAATAFAKEPIEEVIYTQDRVRVKDEIVSRILSSNANPPITLKSSNEYQLVFEQATQGLLPSLMMDTRNLKTPVIRMFFNIIPQGKAIKVTTNAVIASSPDTPQELVVDTDSPQIDRDLTGFLQHIKFRIEQNIPVATKSAPKETLGFSVRDSKIIKVQPGSQAEKAGLKKGDIIVEVDGIKFSGSAEWLLLNRIQEGRDLKITYKRHGSLKTIILKP